MIAILILALIPISIVIRGWSLAILWGMFVVSFGLPVIGIAHAIGLVLLIQFVAASPDHSKAYLKDEDSAEIKALKSFGFSIMHSVTVVGIGWIITKFM